MRLVPPPLPTVDPVLLRRRLKPVGEGAELAGDGEERRAPDTGAEAIEAEADTAAGDAPESLPAAPVPAPDPRRSTADLSVMSRAELAPDVDPDI